MITPPTVWLLTTVDNPYSPFNDFNRWYMEDSRLGYNTCSMIARLTSSADDFNDDADFAVMRQIIQYDWSGKHVMVTQATWAREINSPV